MRILWTGGSSGMGKTMVHNLRHTQIPGSKADSEGGIFPKVVTIGPGEGNDYRVDFAGLTYYYLRNILWKRIVAGLGGLPDVLVNNSGVTYMDSIQKHGDVEFTRVMEVNLTIPFYLSKIMVEFSYDQPGVKRIINVSSMAASFAMRYSSAYCASKAGLEALTKSMARELAPAGFGARWIIMGIAPAVVEETGMYSQILNLAESMGYEGYSAKAHAVSRSALGRPCTQEEIWKVFKFLIFDAPEYMTGSIVHIPGGMGV